MTTNLEPLPDSEQPKPLRPRKQRAAIFYQLAQRHGSYEFILDDQRKPLKDWAQSSNIPLHNLYQRIFILGWDIRQATSTPLHSKRSDGLEPDLASLLIKDPKPKRDRDRYPSFTPFISDATYSASLSLDNQETIILSDLSFDFQDALWHSPDFPSCSSPSRPEVCLKALSLFDEDGKTLIDEDALSSLLTAYEQGTLKLSFRRLP